MRLAAAHILFYLCLVVLASRLLVAGGGASFAATDLALVGIYNGNASSGATYSLGWATSDDTGQTWTREASNPVLEPGSSGAWDDAHVAQAALIHDGSQYVVFYSGHDGAKWQIGRATSSDGITWAKDAGNPVLSVGAGGAFDASGVNFPTVLHDPDMSPAWNLWYAGWAASGDITIGHATSSDGASWTKQGEVIGLGPSGAFDDEEAVPGAILRVGSTYRLYYAGRSGPVEPFYATGYATASDPAGPWTKQGVLADLRGIMSLGGVSWESWHMRSIISAPGYGYRAFGSAFHPTGGTFEERAWAASSADGLAFPTLEVILPVTNGQWDDHSSENISVVVAP